MLLHVLRHIDADHAALIVEECLSQRFRELCLADARRAEEDERADWAVRVLDAGTCAQDGFADSLDRFVLSDDARVQDIFEVQQFLALARQHFRHGDPRPAADDLRDILFADLFFQKAAVLRLGRDDGLFVLEFLLELRQLAVLEFRHAVEVVGALSGLHLAVHAVNLFLDGADAQDGILLSLPLRSELRLLFLEFFFLLRDLLELLLGGFIRLLLQGLLLDLELHDLAADLIERLRHGFDFRAQLCGRLIDEVDGLIRQEAVRDVAIRQRCRCNESCIADAHAVMDLIALLEAAQDRDRVLDARLADHDRLEATLEGRILLDVLAVLVERRRTDAAEFTAGQHRLQEVAGIHCTFRRAGADDRVKLIDEEQDLAVRLRDLIEDALEAFLELTAVFRTSNQGAHVE